MHALQTLLDHYRQTSQSEREKGTYFEELCVQYLRNEPSYQDLYSDVWTYSDWAAYVGLDKIDTGIDLVAKTRGTDEYHAIQCKLYATDYKLQKADIDSFFTASGKKPFTQRLIIATTNNWSEHAEDALRDQQPPCFKIDLAALENSQIDWSKYQPKQALVFKAKKSLREHQISALNAAEIGLATAHRGKLIMACGTGKTFTSLKIAEKLAGKGKRVLFLVPSLSLLSQTLTEWTQESATPLHSFAVCSDSDVGKKRKKDDDVVNTHTHELQYPATTEPKRLAFEMNKRHDAEHMSVVFSTYHSIQVISEAQKEFALADFDLIICDEAHRTTGATFGDDDESNFVKVHDATFIQAAKRLYMTATPRIYGEAAKVTAERDSVAICSMDDVSLYGEELYVITFSEAVSRKLLVDYKVIVLAVDESHIHSRLQNLLKDENNQLKVDDAAKIIGCWKALSKQGTQENLADDADPMRRAVAFCQVIEPSAGKAKVHKVSSKNIANMFSDVVEAYQEQEVNQETDLNQIATYLRCQAEHVDGSMNASEKEIRLNWLKAESPESTCRILSNVRCLSEGVDVPALDAVLFLTPRNSQVDVVQSVGRVMRLAEGKKRGYVILPVVIPAGVEAHDALNDNKTYKVVWQVLQALRSHDDRFDAMINKMDLDLNSKMLSKMEVIAVTDKINPKSKAGSAGQGKTGKGRKNTTGQARGGQSIGGDAQPAPEQVEIEFEIGEIERAIYAKVVQKCGNRAHWEDWANDIAKIARTHIDRIQAILDEPANTTEIAAFKAFANELRDDLNNAISDGEIVEMLAQHLITKPVFDALFSDYSFAKHNPMSIAMQDVLDTLNEHHLDKEADTLQRFYDSVKMRAEGIDNAAGKQKIVVELYDKFFRNAFPKMTERLGIVYTPVEVVDFIIHSVNDILKSEFNQTLGDKNVHIIDPFTGTGTFITRLIQSGLISDAQLPYKYKNEIHANELVLLAYYIAAINIEAVYHDIIFDDYAPFNGICLTDTFQMYEQDDMVDAILVDNSARRKRQKKLDLRVIIGNPPYSSGQESANDNNANVSYPTLDEKIRSTYAAQSSATNKNALYDSYIRAIRWASDRIKDAGVIGFVTNAGWVEANTGDGLRKCLADEFSSIYVFHLRGNQRTSGELSRREGGKIFGSGSRAPIAISILVKNPNAKEHGKIYFHDIGDYLSQSEKLEKINDFSSIDGITNVNGWSLITPDDHGDWVNQRDDSFSEFISLGDKKNKTAAVIFENYSGGLQPRGDAWFYNSSKSMLKYNIEKSISFFNNEVDRYLKDFDGTVSLDQFVKRDPSQFSWYGDNVKLIAKKEKNRYESKFIQSSLYRPYSKSHIYFDPKLMHRQGKWTQIFPKSSAQNQVIFISGNGNSGKEFSAIMCNVIPDINMQHSGGQSFPLELHTEVETQRNATQRNATQRNATLYRKTSNESNRKPRYLSIAERYERVLCADGEQSSRLASYWRCPMLSPLSLRNRGEQQMSNNIPMNQTENQGDLFTTDATSQPKLTRKDGISDAGLAHFQAAYPDTVISKEDLFYYIYGLLHSEEYKTKYADNLSKELPRIPCVKKSADFMAFSQAGRDLAHWHLNYETIAKYPVEFVGGNMALDMLEDKDFYVTNMKFASKADKTTVIYNHKITMKGIPLEAYDYIVNGKSALDWVMERQGVSTHKDSGIVNDANDWANETMGNARYPLELFQRVITVSLETMKIVRSLPKLDI